VYCPGLPARCRMENCAKGEIVKPWKCKFDICPLVGLDSLHTCLGKLVYRRALAVSKRYPAILAVMVCYRFLHNAECPYFFCPPTRWRLKFSSSSIGKKRRATGAVMRVKGSVAVESRGKYDRDAIYRRRPSHSVLLVLRHEKFNRNSICKH